MSLLKILIISDVANKEQHIAYNHLLEQAESDIILTINDRVPIQSTNIDEEHIFCYRDDDIKTCEGISIYRHDIWAALAKSGESFPGTYIITTDMSIEQAITCSEYAKHKPCVVVCASNNNNEYEKIVHNTWFICPGSSPTAELYYTYILADIDSTGAALSVYHSHSWYFDYQKRR